MQSWKKLSVRQKRDAIKRICREDRDLFNRYFFPHYITDEPCEMHSYWTSRVKIKFSERKQGWREVFAAPRGNAKTTIENTLDVIHDIVYEIEPYIVIISETEEAVKQMIDNIKIELENNQQLIDVYGSVVVRGNWSVFSFTTSNGIRVVGRTIKQQLRSLRMKNFRPSKIIVDDPESQANTRSADLRKKLVDWQNKDLLKCGDRKTIYRHLGTSVHEDCLLEKNLSNPGWFGKKWSSIISWPKNDDLWNKCKKIYCDLTNKNRLIDASSFYEANKMAMCEGAMVLNEQKESLFDLYAMIWTEGRDAFESEKQNNPRDDRRKIFDIDSFVYFDISGDSLTRSDDGRVIKLSDLTYYAYVDSTVASQRRKASSHKPDFFSCVVLGKENFTHNKDGRFCYLYVVACLLERIPIDRQIPKAIELCERWGVSALGCEANSFQELVVSEYRRYLERKRATNPNAVIFPVIPVDNYSNKQDRITLLQPWTANGWLSFYENLPDEMFQQFKWFPEDGMHDDGPDAVEGAKSISTKRGPMLL